jgi:hypothetical protein
MEKVIFFLDMENILLIDLTWYIFPERYLGAEPAGICPSSNHAGGNPVSLSPIPPVSPEMRSIWRFPAAGHCVRMVLS